MCRKVSYRHNIMRINSIDTFMNIKGGFNNHLKDVYFIRGLGEPAGFEAKIAELDSKMGREMADNRLSYLRIKKLPKLTGIEDSDYYSKAYDQCSNNEKFSLKNINTDDNFRQVLTAGIADVTGEFQAVKNGASESMIRNFGSKLLFWLDNLMKDAFVHWNERYCIKIVAENVMKDQEYLFFYFLTLLGCDVLLLENRKDADIADRLKQLSYAAYLGPYGETELGEYVPAAPEKKNPAEKSAPTEHTARPKIKMTIPKRENRNTAPAAAVRNHTQNAEKSFEELAKLASSIVMIAIHNRDGEIIGTGSGIMIGRDGYILTNNHVAAGGSFYSVRIEDDEEIYTTDEVIKYNSTLDLAVIRIQRSLNPLPVYRGERKLVRGQKVVAIGSPLGLFNSVSDGIISGFREINHVDMIQFTAPISHGSSGGAVLNMQGEVIGISTAGMDNGQNINLAVGYESILLFAKGFY